MDTSISLWLTDSEIIANLGQRIKTRRLTMNCTQAQLARETGLSTLTIQKIEDGQNSQLESFIRILRFFSDLDKLDSLLNQSLSPQTQYLNKTKTNKLRARNKSSD
jgi:transcriptional regulator with XRE-family HTH domain